MKYGRRGEQAVRVTEQFLYMRALHGETWHKCPRCEGSGAIDCWLCDGSGDIDCSLCDGTGEREVSCGSCRHVHVCGCAACDGCGDVDCYECGGDGGHDCVECNGLGLIEHQPPPPLQCTQTLPLFGLREASL